MARITASVYTSHVPAIGAAMDLGKTDERRLIKEDEREERELRAYMASSLAAEINNLMPQSTGRLDEQKVPEAAADWVNARQSGYTGPDQGR